MVIVHFLSSLVVGFLIHQTSRIFEVWEQESPTTALPLLGRYAIGAMSLLLCLVAAVPKGWREEVFKLGMVTWVGVGSGVIGAYVADGLLAHQKRGAHEN